MVGLAAVARNEPSNGMDYFPVTGIRSCQADGYRAWASDSGILRCHMTRRMGIGRGY